MISSIGSFYELMTLKLREVMRVMTDNLTPVPWNATCLITLSHLHKNTPNLLFLKKKKKKRWSDRALPVPEWKLLSRTIFARLCLFFFISHIRDIVCLWTWNGYKGQSSSEIMKQNPAVTGLHSANLSLYLSHIWATYETLLILSAIS